MHFYQDEKDDETVVYLGDDVPVPFKVEKVMCDDGLNTILVWLIIRNVIFV